MTSGNSISPASIDVLNLLPQRPPMVMIGRLVEWAPMGARTEFTVSPDCIFCDGEGRLTAYGMIENIAQTCAAAIGYEAYIAGRPVIIGYIGAVRRARVHRLPAQGETLSTEIEMLEQVFGMTLVAARVQVGGETVCECEMKIAFP